MKMLKWLLRPAPPGGGGVWCDVTPAILSQLPPDGVLCISEIPTFWVSLIQDTFDITAKYSGKARFVGIVVTEQPCGFTPF